MYRDNGVGRIGVEVDVAAAIGVAEAVDADLLGEDHAVDVVHDDLVEGHVVLGHGEAVEVLEALRELVSVAIFGEQTDSLLVIDFIRRIEI